MKSASTPKLEDLVLELEGGRRSLTYANISGRDAREIERIVEGFMVGLRRMSEGERAAAAGTFTRWERWVWASRFPGEAPA